MRLLPFLIVFCCCYLLAFVFISGDAFPCEDAQKEEDGGFVWRLGGRQKAAFFFGTIHVPHSLVRVGWAARASFDAADAVFFELDLTDPSTVHRLAHCQRLPRGMTLSDVLPKDLYRRLKRHLDHVKQMIPSWTQERELYPEYLFKAITGGWERRRPVWALLMLESLTEAGVSGGPVLDLWLARRALRMGKRAGAVEQPEEHCLPLNALNHQQVLWALNRSLTRLESGSEGATQDLIRHYNCRNLTHFAHHDEAEGDEIDAYFRRELIEKRNVRMAERVLTLLKENPRESFFFAFGAGHFLGNGNVLDLVREGGGYRVEQVTSPPHPATLSSHSHGWGMEDERPYQRVQLLRSVAPNRHFNDLWVKMDRTPKEPQQVAEEADESSLSPALHPFLWTLVLGLFLLAS